MTRTADIAVVGAGLVGLATAHALATTHRQRVVVFEKEPRVAAHQLAARLDLLTPRQHDVFRVAARGLPNKLIARELNISEATVKTHLTAVFGSLGVSNRTEAALFASRVGLHIG